ncbi:MAG: hypothetical protein CK425_11290 [Parachlamydia sp.]|nr:MAG: hypothetical protein CK425_11290 [Parachlamydia sp.]
MRGRINLTASNWHGKFKKTLIRNIMAIGFCRAEYVKRSSGKNACYKAAYNARTQIQFEGTSSMPPRSYDWSSRPKPVYHEILLPENVDLKFKDKTYLWNAVESAEKRLDSQVQIELVAALPDDVVISLEDRVELIRSFVQQEFIDNGLAAQIDIHKPQEASVHNEGTGELEEKEHNWHAHILVTTRRFNENGLEFEKTKARDLMPIVRNGVVVFGKDWGKEWGKHQNTYFEKKGINLQVDLNGIVSQPHLGPVRMRGKAISLWENKDRAVNDNLLKSQDINLILEKLTENQSIFTPEDLNRYLEKYIEPKNILEIKNAFWSNSELVQLFDKKQIALAKFTSRKVIEEERKIIRLSDRLYKQKGDIPPISQEAPRHLNNEQAIAFRKIISGNGISCLEGHAGTGKSYLLAALKTEYEKKGLTVRALGPDNATAKVLKEHGFSQTDNLYHFLYCLYYERNVNVKKNHEVWIVDEAGKIGNKVLLELLKEADKNHVKIIFSGNSAQLSSVDRGGMFKQFCQRYGCEILSNIQRQKSNIQRDATQKLALGKVSEAFNLVNSFGGFVWSETKDDAIEGLIKSWAKDNAFFSNESSIIIAHGNAEVRLLNEIARSYLKASGRIGTNDYACDISIGFSKATILVSEGDVLEFRKNDSSLGVRNGDIGILRKAATDEFIVALKDQDKVREVIFDPKYYTSFQLGYATTCFRAQGKTLDRAYVLHSPYLNKEMFYVNMTRHVHNVQYFVPREEVNCLAELKRQALRSGFKINSVDFFTKDDIDLQRQQAALQQKIESLENSSKLLDNIKGFSLKTLDSLQSKFKNWIGGYGDRISDQKFYKTKLEESKQIGRVVLVEDKIQTAIPTSEIAIAQEPAPNVRKKRQIGDKEIRSDAFKRLDEPSKLLIINYFRNVELANSLNEIVKSEKESSGLHESKTPHYIPWLQACKSRNESAHVAYIEIPKKKLMGIFNHRSYIILEDRCYRHKGDAKERNFDVEDQLKLNIESLIHRLFPEGPTRTDANGYRFGRKGAFAVAMKGAKMGCFYDHENGRGGGLLGLIELKFDMDKKAARKWALEFLQHPESNIPPRFNESKTKLQKEEEWQSRLPPKELEEIKLKDYSTNLDGYYKLAEVYPYREANGSLIFYNLRLQNLKNLKEKIFLPLSYGYANGMEKDARWSLKRFHSESKTNPIYNLDLLAKFPAKPVLIVEGEKTANAAAKLLDKFVCISWLGGASAASKVNWEPLFNRDVIIWPDNDQAGYKAASEICKRMREVGVSSLRVVDQAILAKSLPEKWDLADPVPKHFEKTFIQGCLLNAHQKAVSLDRLKPYFEKGKSSVWEMLKLNEVLWRVDERLRNGLEERHGLKAWEIEKEILKEVDLSLRAGKEMMQQAESSGVHSDDNLIYQGILYRAKTGKLPSVDILSNMKQQISECSQRFPHLCNSDESSQILFNRTIAKSILVKGFEPDKLPNLLRDSAERKPCLENESKKQITDQLEM